MRAIRGIPVSTPTRRADFNETNPRSSAFIENNPIPRVSETDEGKIVKVEDGKYVVSEPDIASGDGENSIVQNNGTNKAIADSGVAIGKNTQAGSKAFNIQGYDANAKSYTLDSVEGIAVGDFYSIYWRYRRTKFGQIVAISGNTIEVDNLFVPNVSDEEKQEYLGEAYLYIVGKPNLGTKIIGDAAIVSGINNIASQSESDVGGRNNIGDGRYSFTRGLNNITGYACATFGQDNQNLGLKGFIGGGQENYIGPTVERAAIVNYLNQVLANDGFAAGIGNIVDTVAQAKFGKYSRKTSALFAIGNGKNKDEPSNAFAVFEDGHAEVQKTSTSNLSVANRKFVLDAIADAIDGIINGAPDAYNTFKEIADWISEDKTGTSALIERLGQAETDIDAAEQSIATLSENTTASLNKKVDKVANKTGAVGVLAVANNGNAPYVVKSAQDGGSSNGNTFVRRDNAGHLRATSSVNPETDWTKFNSYDAMPRSYIDSKLSAVMPAGGITLGTISDSKLMARQYLSLPDGVYFVNIYGFKGENSRVNIVVPIYLSQANVNDSNTPVCVSADVTVNINTYYRPAGTTAYPETFDIKFTANSLSGHELTAVIL